MTPDFYSDGEFDFSRLPSSVRLVDFRADFISRFDYQVLQNGWRSGGDMIPIQFLERLSQWKSENSDYLINFLLSLKGPTSFMCYLGIDRSGDVSNLASLVGVDVVDNSDTLWGESGGRHFGAAFFPRNIRDGQEFVQRDGSGQVYLGGNSRPTTNLVIVLDPHYKMEADALNAVISSIHGTEGFLDVSLLLLTESAAKILVMDYCAVSDSPSSLCIRLAEYQDKYKMAIL